MQDAETVTWTPITVARDKYRNGTPTAAASRDLEAMVATRTNIENAGHAAAGVVITKTLYLLDIDAVPTAEDTIVVRGETYQVVGESHQWGDQGVEVLIQRTAAP